MPLPKELDDRLQHVLESVMNHSNSTLPLAVEVTRCAAAYWLGVNDASDFCLQSLADDCMIFGGTNRLIWRPSSGFVPDRSACTPGFLAFYETIGPLPALVLAYIEGLKG